MQYKAGTFTVVPNLNLLAGKNPILQVIYMWISDYSNKSGICFPSQKKLSEKCGISINSLKKYLKELEDLGILVRNRRYNNNEEITSEYKMMILSPVDTPPPPVDTPPPLIDTPPPPVAYRTIPTNNKLNNTINNIDLFNKFWIKYPNKKSKDKAEEKFISILSNKKVSFEKIMEGLDIFIKYHEKEKTVKKFIKHPATRLNQGCWEDEYDVDDIKIEKF